MVDTTTTMTVTQDAADLARSAKKLSAELKEALKTRDPWEKEVAFLRNKLRVMHLKLLLVHPFAKDAKDADNNLWMQTSYIFISNYKQRISILDKKLYSRPREEGRPDHSSGGPVEYRKILSRFRQFLAEEEKFYCLLLLRLQKQFNLKETDAGMNQLALLPPEEGPPTPRGEAGRNVFPPEPVEPTQCNDAEKTARLATFSKFLVCFGDIARYREQYNEAGGRPRAGHEDGAPVRRGRGRRGGASDLPARPRNYTRAEAAYASARFLAPDDGNPFHGLAILMGYQKERFNTVYYYYRALSVRQPFDPAVGNLASVLRKGLEEHASKRSENQGRTNDEVNSDKARVEKFLDYVLILHGLWEVDMDPDAARAVKYARIVNSEFYRLLQRRLLPIEVINKVIIIALGALWKICMIRDPNVKKDAKRDASIQSLMASHVLDLFRTLVQVGSTQLAERSEESVHDPTPLDKEGSKVNVDLAQRITATFRRTLPALRISSKWLVTNFSYITSSRTSNGTSQHFLDAIDTFWEAYVKFVTALGDAFPPDDLPTLKMPLEEDMDMNGFMPVKKLMMKIGGSEGGLGLCTEEGMSEVHPNEEMLMRISDILQDGGKMAEIEGSPICKTEGSIFILRRIDDDDAEEIAVASPSVEHLMEFHPNPPTAGHLRDDDTDADEHLTQTSGTGDDPVGDAFRTALASHSASEVDDEDDQEDEIVWNPKISISPIFAPVQSFPIHPIQPIHPIHPIQPIQPIHPIQPIQPIDPVQPIQPIDPIQPPQPPPPLSPPPGDPSPSPALAQTPLTPRILPTTTTAADLMNKFGLTGHRPIGGDIPRFSANPTGHRDRPADREGIRDWERDRESSAPQASMLFGSGSPVAPTTSIWTSTNITPGAVGAGTMYGSPIRQGVNGLNAVNIPQPHSPIMQHHFVAPSSSTVTANLGSAPQTQRLGHGHSHARSLSHSFNAQNLNTATASLALTQAWNSPSAVGYPYGTSTQSTVFSSQDSQLGVPSIPFAPSQITNFSALEHQQHHHQLADSQPPFGQQRFGREYGMLDRGFGMSNVGRDGSLPGIGMPAHDLGIRNLQNLDGAHAMFGHEGRQNQNLNLDVSMGRYPTSIPQSWGNT